MANGWALLAATTPLVRFAMKIELEKLDHLVLTVSDIATTIHFFS